VINDNLNGSELWITDGTDPGTHIVKDIFPELQAAFQVLKGFVSLEM